MPTIPSGIIKAYRTELRRLVTNMRRRTQLAIESYSATFGNNAESKITTGDITFPEHRFNELSRLIRVGIYSDVERAKSTTTMMVNAIINNAEFYAAKEMKRLGYGDTFFTPLPSGTAQTIISRHNQELDNTGIELDKDLVRFIQDSIMDGLKINQIMAKLVDVYKKSWKNAEALARTEANRFWNLVMEQRYVQMGVTHFQWITAGSSRAIKVCPICKPLNGKIFKIGQDIKLNNGKVVKRPPAHNYCRCGTRVVPPKAVPLGEILA